ncbi:hypothetical protein CAZ31_22625, partial [Pseudomonas aeruginosa]
MNSRPPVSPLVGGCRLFISFGSVQINKATTEPAHNFNVVRPFSILTVLCSIIRLVFGVLLRSVLARTQMHFVLPRTVFHPL